MSIDIEKNKQYYANLDKEELCQCGYCINYQKQIRKHYPHISEYLHELGINIEKPFETMPVEVDEMIEYIEVQYIVFGTPDKFVEKNIEEAKIYVTKSHPNTDISKEHFVIGIGPIMLKMSKNTD